MLAIRLRKMGSKKRPYFRVVVTDSRAARDGRVVEVLGQYAPRAREAKINVDHQRVQHWLKAGARPSDTVRTLLARARRKGLDTPPEPAAPERSRPEGAENSS